MDVNLGKKPEPLREMSEDRAKRWDRETQRPGTGSSGRRAEGLGCRERTALHIKVLGGVRGLLGDGFHLILASREDLRRGQQRDLGLKPAVPLTSWVSLGGLPGFSQFQFTHKTIQINEII